MNPLFVKPKPRFTQDSRGNVFNFMSTTQMFPTPKGYVLLDEGSSVVDWQEHKKYDTQKMKEHYMEELGKSKRLDVFNLNDDGFIQFDWISQIKANEARDELWVINKRNERIYVFKASDFRDFGALEADISKVLLAYSEGRAMRIDWEAHRRPKDLVEVGQVD